MYMYRLVQTENPRSFQGQNRQFADNRDDTKVTTFAFIFKATLYDRDTLYT
jgi:hypothetical protein